MGVTRCGVSRASDEDGKVVGRVQCLSQSVGVRIKLISIWQSASLTLHSVITPMKGRRCIRRRDTAQRETWKLSLVFVPGTYPAIASSCASVVYLASTVLRAPARRALSALVRS